MNRGPAITPSGCVLLLAICWFTAVMQLMTSGSGWGYVLLGLPTLVAIAPRIGLRHSGSWATKRLLELVCFVGVLTMSFPAWRPAAWRAMHPICAAVVRKAASQSANCLEVGETAFQRSARILIWDAEKGLPHEAQGLLDRSAIYEQGSGPLTVFLVNPGREMGADPNDPSRQIRLPIRKDDIRVVQFNDSGGAGYLVACHEVDDTLESIAEWAVGGVHNPTEWGEGSDLGSLAERGDLRSIRAALDASGESLRKRLLFKSDGEGQTPLHRAAAAGHEDIVELLLANRAEVNVALNDKRDSIGRTPLHLAIHAGHADVAAVLLAHGADLNVKDRYEETPLITAVLDDNVDTVQFLLANNADANLRWGGWKQTHRLCEADAPRAENRGAAPRAWWPRMKLGRTASEALPAAFHKGYVLNQR